MLETFIPLKIKPDLEINTISFNLDKVLNSDFVDVEKKGFNSRFLDGISFKTNNINYDLIALLNGEFGEFYFLDYDFIENRVDSFGTKILKPDDIGKNIESIYTTFEGIISELKSDKLLTNSKKEEIRIKINKVFFSLSAVIFLLYSLRDKTEQNLSELSSYSGEIAYEGQASLIGETSKTKKIELQANIDKLEGKVEIFLEVVGRIFI